MSESKLRNLSMDFAVEIVNLVRELRANHETVIEIRLAEVVPLSA